MKLALHRSITFWSGILVIAFIAWTWWDSMHWESSARHGQYRFAQAGSGICLADLAVQINPPDDWSRQPVSMWQPFLKEFRLDAPEMVLGTGRPDQKFDYYEPDFGPRNAAACHFAEVLFPPQAGVRAVFIPHWLLLLAFALPWSALLGWRARRRKRATPIEAAQA